ncbi:MAG: hypothetical protein JW982_09190 [Spirochaetes bacterium]|nr:hypothetical protein [Spirochaetota bacterium]
MKTICCITLLVMFVFLPYAAVIARDYYDPAEIRFPLNEEAGGFLNSYTGILEYSSSALNHDDWDSFYIKVTGAPVLFQKGNLWALNIFFSSILMNGPVREEEKAANIGNFWMNAVQFEYGSNLQFRIRRTDFVYSYSRSSQHPFRENYSYAANDQQLLRIRPAYSFETGNFSFHPSLTAGYFDLYGFWKSDLEKPRVKFMISPEMDSRWKLSGVINIYILLKIDALQTWTGNYETDFYAESGLKKTGSPGMDFFLQMYRTENSEMLESAKHDAFYAGFGVRFR